MQIIQYTSCFFLISDFAFEKSNLLPFIDDIMNLSELVTISGVLAGFIFTGLSLMLTFLEKKEISERFKYDFLDHVLAKLFLSILSSVLVIILFAIFKVFPYLVDVNKIQFLITVFFLALFYFVWSLYELNRFLRRLKKIL